jgi:spore maturation protein CgeB
MRLLIIGSALPGALELFYLHHLEQSGMVEHLKLLNIHGQFYQYYVKNIFHKILFRLNLSGIYDKLNSEILHEVEAFQPSHLWVFKGMEIFPETLQKIKIKGVKLINYNPDNPFIFSGRGSGNQNIINSIRLYDLHFTYNLSIFNQLKEQGQKAVWLPFGFESNAAIFAECQKETEVVKVCFVGNPDVFRKDFLCYLADQGIAIDVYGKGWKINHPLIKLYDSVYGINFWRTLRKYRVQLNPLRPHNLTSHGMRSFEVPGIGGILLAPSTPEHAQFFRADEEAFFYSNMAMCVEKINYLLRLSKDEVDIIRDSARKRSLTSGYDYKCRSLEALQHIIKA